MLHVELYTINLLCCSYTVWKQQGTTQHKGRAQQCTAQASTAAHTVSRPIARGLYANSPTPSSQHTSAKLASKVRHNRLQYKQSNTFLCYVFRHWQQLCGTAGCSTNRFCLSCTCTPMGSRTVQRWLLLKQCHDAQSEQPVKSFCTMLCAHFCHSLLLIPSAQQNPPECFLRHAGFEVKPVLVTAIGNTLAVSLLGIALQGQEQPTPTRDTPSSDPDLTVC